MIDLPQQHLNMVKSILNKHLPKVPVWVFGSRIKGTAKPYSDLDLAIVGQNKIPLPLYFKILDDFEESLLPIRVDVIDWHRIDDSFKKIIENQHVVINDI